MSWWETLHLVTWWKRRGISAIKTGQDAPSWIWCTERLSVFGGGHIVLQRFVHVRCHFQPLPTKLVFAYFDRGSHGFWSCVHLFQHFLTLFRHLHTGFSLRSWQLPTLPERERPGWSNKRLINWCTIQIVQIIQWKKIWNIAWILTNNMD